LPVPAQSKVHLEDACPRQLHEKVAVVSPDVLLRNIQHLPGKQGDAIIITMSRGASL
jgi:hypothetical protein